MTEKRRQELYNDIKNHIDPNMLFNEIDNGNAIESYDELGISGNFQEIFDEITKRLNLVKPTEGSDFYESYNSYWYDH